MGWQDRPRPGLRGKGSRAVVRMDAGLSGEVIGPTIRPETETSYHGASRRARDMASWLPWRLSPDSAWLPEQDVANARTEDLVRNNGIAGGARRTLVDNVVGPRITCKPAPDRIMLGKDPSWVQTWSRIVESEWNTFADTTWFDAGGRHTFHSATRVAVKSLFTNGEAFALPLWVAGARTGDRSRWFTRIQLVHPARVSNPNGMQDSAQLRGGIELNEYGEPVAYHIRRTHPGDRLGGVSIGEWERIPAYQTWGRVRVIHLYDQEDVGQTRGVSALVAVLRQFKMFDRYSLEELRKAVLGSLIFAAVESPLDQGAILNMLATTDNPEPNLEDYYAALEGWRANMQGGMFVNMPPGTKMNPFVPAVNQSLDQFSTVILRHIATGLNSSYELLFRDFSKTNYSSARAALLEAWRHFESVRQLLIDHWIRPIFDLWFEEAVNRGRIPDCTPADYYGNQVAWTRAKFLFSPRGWVDPKREAEAIEVRKRAGIATLEQLGGEQGMDWVDMLEQQRRENDLADELGLPRPHRADTVSAVRTPPSAAPEPADADSEAAEAA